MKKIRLFATRDIVEVTSATQLKAIDVSVEDFTWNPSDKFQRPFKIWANAQTTLSVILFGDYLEYKKAGKLADLETDKKQSMTFSESITPALLYKVCVDVVDTSAVFACV